MLLRCAIKAKITRGSYAMPQPYILWFNQLNLQQVDQVGGKNASLGEMIQHLTHAGVKVPNGFATTAEAFREFLAQNDLDTKIYQLLDSTDIENLSALQQAGKQIREWIMTASFSNAFVQAVEQAYQQLIDESASSDISVAVRSSATAEDLPEASFAGQQETLLNVQGIDNVLHAIKQVFASLFNDRAIAYRVHHNFEHQHVALSAGIQRMVRSDLAASGVMFTIDTETGFDQVVMINAAYGLGEMVVQGAVNPDEFYVYKKGITEQKPAVLRRQLGSKQYKMIYHDQQNVTTVSVDNNERTQFCINDEQVTTLARYALAIEQHYQRPMDIEWAQDGIDGQLYILQARPETVMSRDDQLEIKRYQLQQRSEVLTTGRSIGQLIASGHAKVINDVADMHQVSAGDILVTDMTDPDWEPIMKKAAAIVTNRGGRTCHAAIIARELGIPAIVGCENATQAIQNQQEVTVSCAEGDNGYVYAGILPFEIQHIDIENLPSLPVKISMNVANPERAFAFQSIPNSGVGLARLEFIISNTIGIHPKALLNFQQLPSEIKTIVTQRVAAYNDPIEFYIERLKEGIATIAAAFYPQQVIVRLSDFKSNEYRNLLGGHLYEPEEENPMLGFRGASRYINQTFRDCFALECEAIKRVRNLMGLDNVAIMIPFVRTLNEAKQVIHLLKENELKSGENKLKIIMMCEIPANAILAEEFLQYFDGFSIGSNDLTQLCLGLDRDSGVIAHEFNERDPAVKAMITQAIQACRKQHKYIGICGQAPSDYPDFAKWLIEQGIESMSLNPDSVLETTLFLANQK
jgi:pyruvate,water dikinase